MFCFHFALDSANYVAGPELNCKCSWPTDTNTVLPAPLAPPSVAKTTHLPGSGDGWTMKPEHLYHHKPCCLLSKDLHFAKFAPKLHRKSPTLLYVYAFIYTQTLIWKLIPWPGENSAFSVSSATLRGSGSFSLSFWRKMRMSQVFVPNPSPLKSSSETQHQGTCHDFDGCSSWVFILIFSVFWGWQTRRLCTFYGGEQWRSENKWLFAFPSALLSWRLRERNKNSTHNLSWLSLPCPSQLEHCVSSPLWKERSAHCEVVRRPAGRHWKGLAPCQESPLEYERERDSENNFRPGWLRSATLPSSGSSFLPSIPSEVLRALADKTSPLWRSEMHREAQNSTVAEL